MRTTTTVLAAVALVVALAVPAVARPDPGTTSLSDYDRYLLDHLEHEGRARGDRIMAGADHDLGDAGTGDARATATAAELTANVTQNGVCNDQRPVREVGAQETFWVHDFDTGSDREVTFELAAVTEHVYMWVDVSNYDPTNASGGVGPVTSKAEAEDGAERFEEIYAVDRAYFGHEARCDQLPYRQPPRMETIWGQPWYDADDDLHINILNFKIQVGAIVVAGYYSSADEYPTSVNPHSNEGEFFYMNSALFDPGTPTYSGILAHEFYHMIQFPNDANEETWVNEGMADIAIEVNGFDVASHLSDYAANTDDQLTHWDGGELNDYGNAYTYLSYLLEHYSGPDDPGTEFKENYTLAEHITKVAEDGMDGLTRVLAENPNRPALAPYYRDRDALDVYLDRGVANILNDRSVDVGQYGYYELSSFQVELTGEHASYPASGDGSLQPFAERYHAFDSAADGDFTVSADPTIPIVPNRDGMPSPPHEVWLNRGDEMETWIVRGADLTGASAPALEFGYWYDIEEDWDYAYLQVSTDGGATWTNLDCGCGSRDTDPNGNNQGNGITGRSGVDPVGSATGADATWQTHSQDLSAYAGQEVLIRFRYQTDAAVTNPGFTLDDVSLVDGSTTIWAEEDFESGPGGFTLDGDGAKRALIIDPIADNELVLQLVKVGRTVDVDRFPASAAGDQVTATGAMDATRTIAIFSSLTPISSSPYVYAWEANASPIPDLTPPELDDPGDAVEQPFELGWSRASDAGELSADRYLVEYTDLLAEHIADGAEDGLGAWETSTEGTGAFGWTTRSDKTHSGSSAFWAGAAEGATDTSALMTFAEPIAIPEDGTTTLSFWNFHMNESDDQVAVEVSEDGERWVPVFTSGRSALPDEALPAIAEEPLHRNAVDLARWKGRTVQVRFRYTAGPDNRVGSQPYGWWVDDILLETQDWQPLAEVDGTALEVDGLAEGTYHFRVAALYSSNFLGPWSNVVSTQVQAAGTGGGGGGGGGGGTTGGQAPDGAIPATGGGAVALGLVLLGGALGLRRRARG